jgi:serine/threonine protein kinase/Tfp pilus assembly protein PilF
MRSIDCFAGAPRVVNGDSKRVCQVCGAVLGNDNDLCPVCALRGALTNEQAISESSIEPTLSPSQLRFEYYEVLMREDGTPFELGRGAMGVTYKAVDVNLQCVVALKVISARFLGDESAHGRFVREARAAASVRHPNIASVFHLGKSGDSYFYAMEFVPGETLEDVIATQGPLNVMVALDIAAQVASALAAAHQVGLVHRDIKPANIIVSFDGRNRPVIKVIDFGLVKVSAETSDDSSASQPGIFLGTPRYASPEQFDDRPVDIRSDIYALGITLWEMLTKSAPFDGSPVKVAGQHLQASLPIDKLRYLPQPVVTLVTHLLEKDPDDRPQTPEELLTLLRATMRALSAPHGIIPLESAQIAPHFRQTPKLRRWVYLGGALLLLTGLSTILFLPSFQLPFLTKPEKSVAVIPFDNVGDDKQNEYFSDGLTSEVIFQLSKISDVRVISRSSVLRYKSLPNVRRKPLREIGAELEVATVLESSVQRAGNRVKIVTILYDAHTDRRLWGASYDREIKDIFAIQSDVAENIAAALQVRLSADERASIQQRPTENLTAYDLYLRGQASYQLRHKDDNDRAIEYFQQALEADSNFALGYAGLANAYIQRTARFDGEDFWVDSAIRLAQRAITLDPEQARGYAVLGRAFFYKGWLDKARESVQKALRLAPNDEEVNIRAANLLPETAQFADWYAAVRKCESINPEDPSHPYLLAAISRVVGDNALMEKWMQRAIALEVDPDRSRLMQCEQTIFRRDFKGALECLRQLPPEVSAYGSSAMEYVVGCSERVGDWPSVVRLTSAALEKGETEQWAYLHLALALRASGQNDEASQKMHRLMDLTQAKLANKGNDALSNLSTLSNWYLAAANRLLERKDEAYQYLRKIFPRMIEYLDLSRDDYSLELFAPDIEFKNMMSEFDRKIESYRARIREIERSFEKGGA